MVFKRTKEENLHNNWQCLEIKDNAEIAFAETVLRNYRCLVSIPFFKVLFTSAKIKYWSIVEITKKTTNSSYMPSLKPITSQCVFKKLMVTK